MPNSSGDFCSGSCKGCPELAVIIKGHFDDERQDQHWCRYLKTYVDFDIADEQEVA